MYAVRVQCLGPASLFQAWAQDLKVCIFPGFGFRAFGFGVKVYGLGPRLV